ncbi:MAG: DUF3833 family protein [Pseudomonadota bacterium]
MVDIRGIRHLARQGVHVLIAVAALVVVQTAQPTRAADASGTMIGEDALVAGFKGRTFGSGYYRNLLNGDVTRFDVDLIGRWDGQTLTLREDFRFDDGRKDRKTWRFTRTGPGTYTGTREDVVGQARVRVSGNRATLAYDVLIDTAKGQRKVHFSDVLIFNDDGTVLNTARVTKLLFPVARVQVNFARTRRTVPVPQS